MPTWSTQFNGNTDSFGYRTSTDSGETTIYSYSNSHSRIVEQQVEAAIDEITDALREERNSLNTAPVNEHMEHNSLAAWFLDRALESYRHRTIAARFPEYGNRAAESLVLEDAKRQFDERVNGIGADGDHIVAFNDVTDDWPHLPRPVFAGYLVRSDSDYPDEFTDEAREFAEAEAVLDRDVQTELNVFHDENPYHDDSLTDSEAKILTTARTLGIDDSGVPLSEIENSENFISWLIKTNDVEKSLRLHHFGTELSEDIMQYAAEPSEWDIPTSDLLERECVRCGRSHTRITHHEHGVAFVNDSGETAGHPDTTDSDEFYYTSTVDGGLICEGCWPDWGSNDTNRSVIVTTNGIADVEATPNFMRDIGMNADGLLSLQDLRQDYRNDIINSGDVTPTGYQVLSAGDGPTREQEAEQRLIEAVHNPDALPELDADAPVIFTERSVYDGCIYDVAAPQDNWEACRYMKEVLDGTREVTA